MTIFSQAIHNIIFVCALSNANTAMTNEVFDYVWADKIEIGC